LQQRLPIERGASEHTRDSYAYAFRLLFEFASTRCRVAPSALRLEDIDAPLVLAFLEHIERVRGNSPRSRNARLAAIRSFMRFVEYRVPSALDQVRRILAIPLKKIDTKLIPHLTVDEMKAILNGPDPTTIDGIRDRAMLHVGFLTGVRVSELVGLRLDDLTLQPQPCLKVRGKGRRERILPLSNETMRAVRAWLKVRDGAGVPELFLNARGQPLTRSGFEYVLRKHVDRLKTKRPTLESKRISPHVLRHTCAMLTLQATRDIRKVSLWLGHATLQTTEIYTRADPTEKLETVNAIIPPSLRRGHFRPSDRLLALLKPPYVMSSEERSPPSRTSRSRYPTPHK
jgi:site-specific recombinase XerD